MKTNLTIGRIVDRIDSVFMLIAYAESGELYSDRRTARMGGPRCVNGETTTGYCI